MGSLASQTLYQTLRVASGKGSGVREQGSGCDLTGKEAGCDRKRAVVIRVHYY